MLLLSFKPTEFSLLRPPSVTGLIIGAPSDKKELVLVAVWGLVFQEDGDRTLPCCPSRVLFGQALHAPGVWHRMANSEKVAVLQATQSNESIIHEAQRVCIIVFVDDIKARLKKKLNVIYLPEESTHKTKTYKEN